MRIPGLLALAALATPAGATPPVPSSVDLAQEAELQFQLGLRAYRERDLDHALGHLLASNRLVPNANVVFNLGRVHEARGDLPSAWRYYDQYVRIEQDPVRRAEAEVALARIEPHVARVRVDSDPPGARVFLERTELGSRGVTPVTLALPPGEHRLLVAPDGGDPVVRDVELPQGASTEVTVTLARPAAPPPSSGRFWATVSAGGVPLLAVDDAQCTLLGDVRAGYRDVAPPERASGSAVAAALPPVGLVVDLQRDAGPPVRAVLEPSARKGLALRDATPLWPVFERCVPQAPSRLAERLGALPKPARRDAVRLFAEWAAWRGAADVVAAGEACVRGECTALAQALAP